MISRRSGHAEEGHGRYRLLFDINIPVDLTRMHLVGCVSYQSALRLTNGYSTSVMTRLVRATCNLTVPR